jgi:hypothetical protein
VTLVLSMLWSSLVSLIRGEGWGSLEG